MKRLAGVVLGVCVIAMLAFVGTIPLTATSSSRVLFSFDGFAPVSGVFVGPSMPMRGVPGGGLPWVISEAKARLMANGEFELEVQGLVIDPSNLTAQAKGVGGINPAPEFFATISCLDNTSAAANVNTTPVPATTSGDAQIDQTVTLPSTCFAPIVLIRGSFSGQASGPWFAVSGF